MGRRFNEDPPRKLTLSIPASTLAQVELHLLDPVAGRVGYGNMSGLVTSLFKQWLASQPIINRLNPTLEKANDL